MSFLLDTNAVSEWVKPRPNAGLIEWMESTDEDRVFISVISLAECSRASQPGGWEALFFLNTYDASDSINSCHAPRHQEMRPLKSSRCPNSCAVSTVALFAIGDLIFDLSPEPLNPPLECDCGQQCPCRRAE